MMMGGPMMQGGPMYQAPAKLIEETKEIQWEKEKEATAPVIVLQDLKFLIQSLQMICLVQGNE